MQRDEQRKSKVKIVYKYHLQIRLQEREIPHDYPNQIITAPDQEYFDQLTKRYIAIKKLSFVGKLRNFVVAYDIIEKTIEAVTIHVISSKEIQNKVKARRWKAYEKHVN